ncbi:MAG: 4Fe-4S dicluster domain-containing protein [Provencibacterium sp.]|jgi:electron transport complex protein RnfC|nr:4Fe-4S dicluster domain-containing protein [Provencibacterium sp.]
MAFLFSRGLILDQHKEPALSRDLRAFTSPAGTRALSLPPAENPAALSSDEIIAYAAEAQIVDERDGLPLDEKLRLARMRQAVAVVADALDDEPYVSSQLNPLFKLSQQAIGGLQYAARAVGEPKTRIAVYKNLSDLHLHIPNTLYGVRVQRITGKYPVEIRAKLTDGPEETLLIGACALIHLYRAIHQAIQQTTCFVTVAGNCVANPVNLEVQIGASFSQVLDRCGLFEEPSRIISGGPMTGLCIQDPDEETVQATTRAVLAFKSDRRDRNYHCIGCGRCVRVCPRGLAPVYLYKAAVLGNVSMLRRFDADQCLNCGTCSYVCPAKLDLSYRIRRAGSLIAALDDRTQTVQPEAAGEEVEEHAQSV